MFRSIERIAKKARHHGAINLGLQHHTAGHQQRCRRGGSHGHGGQCRAGLKLGMSAWTVGVFDANCERMAALMLQFFRQLCGSIGVETERVVVFDRGTCVPLNSDLRRVRA